MLESLGADLALPERRASGENLRGFFEHAGVVALNERLLTFLGGRWDNILFDGPSALKRQSPEALRPWMEEACFILSRDFSQGDFFALKDPRICQLYPFWLEAVLDCGFSPSNIFVVNICRHPVVMAESQAKRFRENPNFYGLGANLLEGAALWLSLTQQTLKSLESDQNIVLLYDELVFNSIEQAQRLSDFLGLESSTEKLQDICDQSVDAKLRRSQLTEEALAEVKEGLPQALSLFRQMQRLAVESRFTQAMGQSVLSDAAAAELRQISCAYLSRLALERVQLRGSVFEIEAKWQEAEAKSDALRQNLETTTAEQEEAHNKKVHLLNLEVEAVSERFRKTISWRVTAPLRLLRRLQNRILLRLGTAWLKMRGQARQVFLKFRKRSPRAAEVVLALIRPLFRWIDRGLIVSRRRSAGPMCATQGISIADLSCRYVINRKEANHGFLVTVVVPNYNHSAYLRERLDSIYQQTYRNFEVILLDDCSTDESRDILEEYRDRYPERTQTIFNERNSGGVFRQWRKAMDVAKGDLVWMAESDDWCALNFLEELVPSFVNEAVSLAYCRTDFMNQDGKDRIWTIEQFLADIDPDLWKRSFLLTAHQLVRKAWSKKNILPNVSSALFRNCRDMPLMLDEQWHGMRIAGDWIFYLHVIRGGLVAYSANSVNYHRMHDANTSTATYSTDAYYLEHEMVAKTVNRLYEVPESVFFEQREIIRQHWLQNRNDYSEQALDRCYNMEAIRKAKDERKPNLLMASLAFSAGGGETFPIQLANLFHKRGYAVTFLNCDQDKPEPGVRKMLRPEIPVVSNLVALAEIIEDFGIDIIHSHHAWVDMSILDMLPQKTRCGTVVSLHGMYETIAEKRLQTILPRLLERTGSLVFTAEKNLTSIKQHGLYQEENFTKIGNALDIYPVTPVDLREHQIPSGAFVLCNVSRAIPEKGWVESVAAVGRARELSGKEIHLILIGEGPEYDQLKKGGCPAYVHLLGFRSNIRDFFAASDLGFLPSKFRGESFPLVVIDCLHSGTPVLSSAVGEVPQMLDANGEAAGILFALEDWEIPIENVASEIARCAADPKIMEKMRLLVPQAAEKFSPQVMCEEYDQVYVNLAQKRSEEGMC